MILLAHREGLPLAKYWRLGENGPMEDRESYDQAIKQPFLKRVGEYHPREGGVALLWQIEDMIKQYQRRRDVCFVRGRLVNEEERATTSKSWKGGLVHRASAESGGHIVDTPEPYLCLDLDSVDTPTGLTGPAAIEWVITARLAPCFHDVSYVWQMSGSSGFKRGLRVKLWFATDRAIDSAELRRLHSDRLLINAEKLRAEGMEEEKIREVIDRKLWSRSQMCFIAAPALGEGVDDPHPQDRLGGVYKGSHVVALPHPTPERVITQVSFSAPSSVLIDRGAQAALHKVREEIAALGDKRYRAIFKAAIYLGRFWRAGRLDRADIERALMEACEINGEGQKRGRRAIERQIRAGLEVSSTKHPLYAEEREARSRVVKLLAPTPPTPPPSPPPPSSEDEINAEVARVIAEAITAAERGAVAVVAVPVGCGKTRAALAAAASRLRARPSEAVLFASSSYDLISEAEQTFQAIDPQGPHQRLEGRLRECRLAMSHTEADEMVRAEIEEGGRFPDICQRLGCPFISTCELAKRRGAVHRPDLSGHLTLTPHAMISHLDKYTEGLSSDPLLFIDEAPPAAYMTTADLLEIKLVIEGEAEGDDVDGWRRAHPALVAWAQSAWEVITTLITPRLKSMRGFTEDLPPATLAAALAPLAPVAAVALGEEVSPPSRDDTQPPTKPLIKARALRVLKVLGQMAIGEPVSAAVAFDDEGVRVEVGSPFKLPQRGSCVILDATLNTERWKLIAAAAGRPLEIIQANTEKLRPHLARGVWVNSTAYSRSHMINGGVISPRGVAALENLGGLLHQHNLIRGKVGIGTHKAVAEAIEQGRAGAGPLSTASISAWAAEGDVMVGYTGRDHRGSNAFEQVDTLLIIGDPTTNIRGERRALETLRIAAAGVMTEVSTEEAARDYAAEITAYQTQWIGRARHQRRSGVSVVYCGSTPPEVMAGVQWEEPIKTPRGKPQSEERALVTRAAWAALEAGEMVSQADLERMGLTRQQARDLWSKLCEEAMERGGSVIAQGRSKALHLPLSGGGQDMVLIGINIYTGERGREGSDVSVENISEINKNHIPPPPSPPPSPPHHTPEQVSAEVIEQVSAEVIEEPAPEVIEQMSAEVIEQVNAEEEALNLYRLTNGAGVVCVPSLHLPITPPPLIPLPITPKTPRGARRLDLDNLQLEMCF
jgi:hypothetical protein